MSDEIIRASEIAEYVFCSRAWWLRRVAGRHGANVREMESGSLYHQGHGQTVGRAHQARLIAYVLLALAVAAIAFGIVQAI